MYESVGMSYCFQDPNGTLLNTEQLSEGYRINVLLLTDILIRILIVFKPFHNHIDIKSIKGIIAIDEFDRHLHPTWQKVYIENLIKFLPNVQFFLTTHNPVSILGREEGEVQYFYHDKEKGICVKPLPNTKNLDAGTILLTPFEMETIISNDLQNKLYRYYDLKTVDNKTNEQIEELNADYFI